MDNAIRILYVDDNPLDRELVRHALEREHGGFQVVEATSREQFEARLAEGGFDLVLTDFNILGFEGLQVLDAVRARYPRVPVIVVTGTGSEEVAVEAMKQGAADYVIKTPKHIRRLPHTIRAAIERRQAEEALRESEQRFRELAEHIREVFWMTDPSKNRMLYVSPGYETIWGRTCESLYQSPRAWVDAIHPED